MQKFLKERRMTDSLCEGQCRQHKCKAFCLPCSGQSCLPGESLHAVLTFLDKIQTDVVIVIY